MTDFNIKVGIDPSKAKTGGNAVRKDLNAIDKTADKLNRTIGRTFALLAGGAAVTRGINILRDYQQQLSTVIAISGALPSQFKEIDAAAQQIGRTTRFSATEAAQGLEFLARAGFTVDQALASLRGTLNLAQSGSLGLGRAADIASNILSGFGKEARETDLVVDVLAKTAARSNTSIEQLGDAMKFVAPIAAGLNISIEQTAAAIGTLSDSGIQGSAAGTGLRRVLAELEAPGEAARRVFADLGVNLNEVKISSVGLEPALRRLARAGITVDQAFDAFGKIGGTPFVTLAKGVERVAELGEEIKKSGDFAEESARIMDNNLNGAFLAVTSAAQGFVLALGALDKNNAFTKFIRSIANGINFLTDNMDLLVEALRQTGIVLGAVFLGGALGKGFDAFKKLGKGATLAGTAVKVLSGGLRLLGGPAGILLTVVGALLLVVKRGEETRDVLGEIADAAKLTREELGKLSDQQLQEDIFGFERSLTTLDNLRGNLKRLLQDQLDVPKNKVGGGPNSFLPGGVEVRGTENMKRIAALRKQIEGIDIRRLELDNKLVDSQDELVRREKERAVLAQARAAAQAEEKALATSQRVIDTQKILNTLQTEALAFSIEDSRARGRFLAVLGLQQEAAETFNADQIELFLTQLKINDALAFRADVLDRIRTPAEDVLQKEKVLAELFDQGLVTQRELLEVELERAGLAADRATTGDEAFNAEIATQIAEAKFAFIDLGQEVASIFGPNGTLVNGISDAAARSIVFGKSFKQAIRGIGQEIATQLLGSLIKIGIQQAINATIGQSLAAAATASTIAQLTAISAAAATPAALTSLASYGANAVPAQAGIAATIASTKAVAAAASATPGFANGGLFRGFGTGTSDSNDIRISDGEFIVNAAATRRFQPLLEQLNSGGGGALQNRGGGGMQNISFGGITVAIENNNGSPEETADAVEERMREVLVDELRTNGLLEGIN